MPYSPGQCIDVLEGTTWRSGVINTVAGPVERYSVRIAHPGSVPNRVLHDVLPDRLRVPTDTTRLALDARRPQLAIRGEYHLGPSRHQDKGEAIHRADLELEEVGGVQYVRLYLSVPTAADITDPDPGTGQATSDFKDVQQDPATGQLFITSGKNRMLWVGGGRPLRALKWAEKYIAEHQKLAEEHRKKLPTATTPTEREDIQKKISLHESLNNPVIRTYLFPLKRFNRIVKKAVPEAVLKQDKFKNAPSFNVDRHYEPNQYGFQDSGLRELARHALAHSLITYTYAPERLHKPDWAGEVRDVRELWSRMGIPEKQLKDANIWVSNGEFTDKKKFPTLAETLSMHLATWNDRSKPFEQRSRSPLLTGNKANIPYFARKEMLDKFLRENEIDPSNAEQVEIFLQTVVSPWASQAMIAHVIAEDYELIQKDENVQAREPIKHDFGAWQSSVASDRVKLLETGLQIDRMLDAQRTPKDIIDLLISRHPQLAQRYAKISAKSEDYSFYVHAQMVLCQYLKLVQVEREDARLIPWKLVAKTILFHDMEKVNSKLQYGKDGEHRLTVDELRKHCYVLGADPAEWKIAVRLVDSDPFGDYFKGKKTAEQTFEEIEQTGRALGYSSRQLPRFFIEYHQYYQADFSSYTSDSRYRMLNGVLRTGKAVFNAYFKTTSGDKIRMKTEEHRYQYSHKDDYEPRYLALKAMFAKEATVEEHARRQQGIRDARETEWRMRFLSDARPAKVSK